MARFELIIYILLDFAEIAKSQKPIIPTESTNPGFALTRLAGMLGATAPPDYAFDWALAKPLTSACERTEIARGTRKPMVSMTARAIKTQAKRRLI